MNFRSIAPIIRRSFSGEAPVHLNVQNSCGVITLNRPKAINALNLDMVRMIYPQLKAWSNDSKISHFLIEGAGTKGFCAGGDVQSVVKSPLKQGAQFFYEEYRLNHLISVLKKPYIALIDGIVMGGGVGLSVHGEYRISTEKSLFAMPETLIGLFPDVGGGHFLPRMPAKGMGLYLALTGHRLKGADLKHAGVSTHHVDKSELENLRNDLVGGNGLDHSGVAKILEKYSKKDLEKFSLQDHSDFIAKHFDLAKIEKDFSAVERIIDGLKTEAEKGSDFATKCLKNLKKMSPVSLKITCRQLVEGQSKTLAEVLEMEYRMGVMSLRDHDFREGVRALLIEKDNQPVWNPSHLEDVTSRHVEKFFNPLEPEFQPEWSVEEDVKKMC